MGEYDMQTEKTINGNTETIFTQLPGQRLQLRAEDVWLTNIISEDEFSARDES